MSILTIPTTLFTGQSEISSRSQVSFYDPYILWCSVFLVCVGLIALTSASIDIGNKNFFSPFHYVIRQVIYLFIGASAGILITRIKINVWRQYSAILLITGIALLILVLIPGIGKEVNGSMRWINLGIMNFQASEYVKLMMIIYLAAYCVSKGDQIRTENSGFVQPMIMVSVISILLLLEPDFGSTFVILATTLSILFIAGVRLRVFAMLLFFISLGLAALAVLAPYRLERLTSFMNPWEHAFNSGYQLTQALIAFGRGEWFGMGVGGSVQKLFYLPEAHTDFLFAVMAEEFGLIGIMIVIVVFALLVSRALYIGLLAFKDKLWFHAYMAIGLGVLLGIQALINMGVNMGILPTKGLTLPLISYGGSSLVLNCILIALLLRISYEYRAKGKAL